MYLQFLRNSFNSPSSVKNYLSGSKIWLLHHGGNTLSYHSIEVKEMVSAVVNLSDHNPQQAYPLTPQDVKVVCDFIHVNPSVPHAVKPCILIGFACFLRASNLVSPSVKSWVGPHTLLANDVFHTTSGLVICIRSTKTLKKGKSTVLNVAPVSDKRYCPVYAWLTFKAVCNPCPVGPAFMVNDSTPLTSKPIVDVLQAALASKVKDGHSLSMHSLRRGGTQTAADAGASHKQLMSHGTWRSKSGLKFYLPKPTANVSRIRANSLA